MAEGQVLLLLNPDTVVPRGGLQQAIAALEARSEVGMLGCKLVRPSGELDHACKRGIPSPLSSAAYFLGLHRWSWATRRVFVSTAYTAEHLGEDEAGEVGAINGAFMLVRRAALMDVGPLDETFWMYGEDLDWCLRFWNAGWGVYYWPGVSVVHVKSGSAGAVRSLKANRAFHQAMWLFYRKHQARGGISPVDFVVFIGILLRFLSAASMSIAKRAIAALRFGRAEDQVVFDVS
jgi:hypothetical protein